MAISVFPLVIGISFAIGLLLIFGVIGYMYSIVLKMQKSLTDQEEVINKQGQVIMGIAQRVGLAPQPHQPPQESVAAEAAPAPRKKKVTIVEPTPAPVAVVEQPVDEIESGYEDEDEVASEPEEPGSPFTITPSASA